MVRHSTIKYPTSIQSILANISEITEELKMHSYISILVCDFRSYKSNHSRTKTKTLTSKLIFCGGVGMFVKH